MPEEPGVVWKILSVLGFLALVGAYLLNQSGRIRPDSLRYLAANTVGAGLLAAYSGIITEWIFVALEGFWCVASARALAVELVRRRLRKRVPGGPEG